MMNKEINRKLDEINAKLQLVLEDNDKLRERLETIEGFMHRAIQDQILTISNLVLRYKVSKSTLLTNPWMLPNFGNSDFPIGVKRWRMATVLEWEDIDEELRKKRWHKKANKKN